MNSSKNLDHAAVRCPFHQGVIAFGGTKQYMDLDQTKSC